MMCYTTAGTTNTHYLLHHTTALPHNREGGYTTLLHFPTAGRVATPHYSNCTSPQQRGWLQHKPGFLLCPNILPSHQPLSAPGLTLHSRLDAVFIWWPAPVHTSTYHSQYWPIGPSNNQFKPEGTNSCKYRPWLLVANRAQ